MCVCLSIHLHINSLKDTRVSFNELMCLMCVNELKDTHTFNSFMNVSALPADTLYLQAVGYLMQCDAVCCNALIHVPIYAAHCNTLQHTATHCNTYVAMR